MINLKKQKQNLFKRVTLNLAMAAVDFNMRFHSFVGVSRLNPEPLSDSFHLV